MKLIKLVILITEEKLFQFLHLTDLTQNDEFEDKYFAGVKLDLSQALLFFHSITSN